MLDFQSLLLATWALAGCCVALIPYNKSIGGTRLRRMPDPFMVVITVTDQWADYPQPDCVGVYVGGYGSVDTSFVLTSPWCIATPRPEDPHWIPQEVRNAVNEVTFSEPFKLLYPFEDNFRLGVLKVSLPVGYWVPDVADMILNKHAFYRHLETGQHPNVHGFSLSVGTNPRVLVVSWDQENCTVRYNEYKLPEWPEIMRDGWFCVFRGRNKVDSVTFGRHVYNVNVGTPCDDALGSPILTSDFNRVLGVIIKTHCDGDRSVAFAMSPAFLPAIIPPKTIATTTTTITPPSLGPPPPLPPPPPYPRIPQPSDVCSASRICSHFLLWTIFKTCVV